MQDLKDMVAVVTGGASGIGRGICRALAEDGAKLVIADIEASRAEEVAKNLQESGAEAIAAACDVTDPDSIAAVADKAYDTFGKVNILCNNAGVHVSGRARHMTEGDWDWLMNVNLKSIFMAVRTFLPRMLEAGEPMHIQNTASEHGVGLPDLGRAVGYTASKHAVVGFSEVLRAENEKYNLEVSVLCPGLVRTDIYDSARNRNEASYGEGQRIAKEVGEPAMADGMHPDTAGRIAVDGIKDNDPFILTHPYIREFVDRRYQQVSVALDKADARNLTVEQSGRHYR